MTEKIFKEEFIPAEDFADAAGFESLEALALDMGADFVRQHLFLALREGKGKMLSGGEEREALGGILYARPMVSIPDGWGSVTAVRITDSLRAALGFTWDEVYAEALKVAVRALGVQYHRLGEFTGIPDADDAPTVVITGMSPCFGAGLLVDAAAIGRAAEALDSDKVWFLPSSIHELIAVPYIDGTEYGRLREMVRAVNADPDKLRPEEILLDRPLLFDAESLTLKDIQTGKSYGEGQFLSGGACRTVEAEMYFDGEQLIRLSPVGA